MHLRQVLAVAVFFTLTGSTAGLADDPQSGANCSYQACPSGSIQSAGDPAGIGCCPAATCSQCGGTGCQGDCCVHNITAAGNFCPKTGGSPPCLLVDQPDLYALVSSTSLGLTFEENPCRRSSPEELEIAMGGDITVKVPDSLITVIFGPSPLSAGYQFTDTDFRALATQNCPPEPSGPVEHRFHPVIGTGTYSNVLAFYYDNINQKDESSCYYYYYQSGGESRLSDPKIYNMHPPDPPPDPESD